MAKTFLKSGAAHLASEAITSIDDAASDDDESSVDGESVHESADFNPRRVLRDFFTTLRERPPGGGSKTHHAFLEKYVVACFPNVRGKWLLPTGAICFVRFDLSVHPPFERCCLLCSNGR